MSPWWWACLLPAAPFAVRDAWLGVRDLDEGLRRVGLPTPWRRKAVERDREPVTVPSPPLEAVSPEPAFTLTEEVQLRDLAARRAVASDGTREAGEDLANRLLIALPGMRAADIARVLLALEPALRDETDHEDADWALVVISDCLLGAPPVLAERAFLEGDRGIEWLTEETGARDGR